MDWELVIAGVVALALLVYLTYALLYPERFWPMSSLELLQIIVYFGALTACVPLLCPVEGLVYRVSGVNPAEEQDWKAYTQALLAFNLLGFLVLFPLQLMQDVLPLNPVQLGGVEPFLAFNTATSFMTNPNWQAYGGETTMSYLTQMIGLNVQNFESRADAVRQITGITIHETVPDSLLDMADEIELIDLSPADLRKRLAEGKVYTPERVEAAANNFFRVGNLTALRLTAEHVDHKLQDYMHLKHIAGPWKSGERLMVAVGPRPFSERLIRWTRRMAYNLEAHWLAVYVETSTTLASKAKERLYTALRST